MADFLQTLRAHGSADLNAVCSTLNDGSLVRETLDYWLGNRWILVAPNSPLQALAGPAFSRDLTLEHFCGAGDPGKVSTKGAEETTQSGEEPDNDENP